MTPRLTHLPWFAVAALAVGGSIALAQSVPAQSVPAQSAPAQSVPAQTASAQQAATAPATPAAGASVERHPAPNTGTRSNGMQERRGGHGDQHGRLHGSRDSSIGSGFHIVPGGLWWRNPKVVNWLALTPEQVKRMDDIFHKSVFELIGLKKNLEKQNKMLEPLLSANPPDTAVAMAQIDKVADARAALEKSDARMLLGIREVLTPEQWTKLNAHKGSNRFNGFGADGHGAGHGPHNFVAPIRQH